MLQRVGDPARFPRQPSARCLGIAAGIALALGTGPGQAIPLPWPTELPGVEAPCPTSLDQVTPLRPGQTATCELSGTEDRHGWSLEASQGELLMIQVAQNGGFGEPCLELSDATGEVLTSVCEANNPRVDHRLAGPAPYRLTVWDQGGDDVFGYRLEVRRLSPPAAETPRLRSGEPRRSALGALGAVHFYRLDAAAGEVYRLQASSHSAMAQPCLELWQGGRLLRGIDALAPVGPCGGARLRLDRRFERPGPVLLLVSDDNDDAVMDYTLVARRLLPRENDPGSSGSWRRLEGRLDPAGSFGLHGLEGVAGEVFVAQVVVVGGLGVPCLELLRSDGSILTAACADSGRTARLEATLDVGGGHGLLVSAEGAEGPVSYALAVARVAPAAVASEPLPRGVLREGRLVGGADLALYTFTALPGAEVGLELATTGGFAEPCFELRRPDGSPAEKGCAVRGETTIRRRLVIDQAGSQVLLVFDRGLDESMPYRISLSAPETEGGGH